MLLENRAPGDASTSDGPSSRTSCALRGLRWPGMPALLIRMVWLMDERLRKRWVWNRYRGRGNGWVGGRTKMRQLLHLPLRSECESLRDCETEGCGSPSQMGIVELKGWIINLTILHEWKRAVRRAYWWIQNAYAIYQWFSTGELQPEDFLQVCSDSATMLNAC